MKKNILIIAIVLCLMVLPMQVKADKFDITNLHEALKQEAIDHDFSDYKENKNTVNNDNKVNIYLFRGKGCSVCRSFLTYLNTIVEKYGDKFQLVSFEVWYDSNNNALLQKVAEYLDEEIKGVPFIVIGDQVFPGYAASYNSDIEKAITTLYNSKDRYDVFKKMGMTLEDSTEAEIYEAPKSENGTSSTAVIVWNFIFTLISTVTIVSVVCVMNSNTIRRIEALEGKKGKGNKND